MDILLFWASFTLICASIICNLAYLPFSRLFFTQAGGVAMAAGFAAQTVMLTARSTRTGKLPLDSPYEWALIAAWALTGVALIFMANRDPKGTRVILGILIAGIQLAAAVYLR